MKIRTTALVAGLLLAGAATAQNAPQGAPPQGNQPSPRQGDGEPPRRGRPAGPNLESAMKAMNGALKQLKANVGDAGKKDDCLKQVAIFQYGCAASKAAPMPGNLGKDLDAAGKAKLETKMREDLRALMATALQLEDAILAGKTDAAAKLVSQLEDMREAGHKAMGVKDD